MWSFLKGIFGSKEPAPMEDPPPLYTLAPLKTVALPVPKLIKQYGPQGMTNQRLLENVAAGLQFGQYLVLWRYLRNELREHPVLEVRRRSGEVILAEGLGADRTNSDHGRHDFVLFIGRSALGLVDLPGTVSIYQHGELPWEWFERERLR